MNTIGIGSIRGLSIISLLSMLVACSSVDNSIPPTPLTKFAATARIVDIWQSSIDGDNPLAYPLAPYVRGDTVFVASHNGSLLALGRADGQPLWRVGIDAVISAGVAGDHNNLYLGTPQGELIALDQRDGSELWRVAMTSEIIAIPTTGDNLVAARSIDGKVALFNADSGREKWSYRHNVPALTVRGNSPALLVPNGVLVGLDNGKLLALSLESGTPLWSVTLSDPSGRSEVDRLNDVDASIQVDDKSIYAAGFQGTLARISLDGGRIQWARELSTIAGFRVRGNAVYVTDTGDDIIAVDRETGNELWTQEVLRARQLTAPVPVGNYVVAGDFEGYIHYLSQFDGRLIARTRIDSSRIVSAVTVADDTVFAQTQNGSIKALRVIVD